MNTSFIMDLARVYTTHDHGDITTFLTWFSSAPQPAIVLLPTAKIGDTDVVPLLVPLATAWRWDEQDGDERWIGVTASGFAATLDIPRSPDLVSRITSIIRQHLGELSEMPSTPPETGESETVADIVPTDPDTEGEDG